MNFALFFYTRYSEVAIIELNDRNLAFPTSTEWLARTKVGWKRKSIMEKWLLKNEEKIAKMRKRNVNK